MVLQRAYDGAEFECWCCILQRPQKVKVRAQNVKGETMMLTLNGWQARIFQHEYDHLQVHQQGLRPIYRDLCTCSCLPSWQLQCHAR